MTKTTVVRERSWKAAVVVVFTAVTMSCLQVPSSYQCTDMKSVVFAMLLFPSKRQFLHNENSEPTKKKKNQTRAIYMFTQIICINFQLHLHKWDQLHCVHASVF